VDDGRQQAHALARTPTIRDCPHFGECGGCAWLDRPYERQLSDKERALRAELAKYPELAAIAGSSAGAERAVTRIVAAPHPHFYRGRLLYPLARRDGHVVGGFFRRGTHDLVDVRSCEIQDPAITKIAERMRSAIARLRIPIDPLPGVVSESQRNADPNEAAARALAVRIAHGTGEAMVGIVTTAGLFPKGGELAEAARAAGEGLESASGRGVRVASVVRNLSEGDGNVVLGRRSVPLLGRDYLEDRFLGLRLRVSLASFFQPNAAAARLAVSALRAFVGKEPVGRLVDAYAGIGILALAAGRSAREVIAIEESESAARDGAANAQRNGFTNFRWARGRAEDELQKIAAEGPIDVVILDPPRAGLAEAVRASVAAAAPARGAYLSCSPATLARDLAALAGTFTIERITPYDFLPQTEHIEALALLRRRGAQGARS
jgi:23S rRNA (uracil-5-)-methyltransferase RumA